MPDFDPDDPYEWKDKEGNVHLIPDLDDDYIRNILHFLKGKPGFRKMQLPVIIAEARERGIPIPDELPPM